MVIHETLRVLPRVRGTRKQHLETAEFIGDGGFARVLGLGPTRVLKLTCCTATQKLLDELGTLDWRGVREMPGLPMVLESWGPVAEDADGMRFHGYVLERLFGPGEAEKRRLARACASDTLRCARERFIGAWTSHVTSDYQALRRAFDRERHKTLTGKRAPYLECRELAGVMASKPCGDTTSAFGFLEQFIARHRAELDVLTRGNILMTAWGQLVLADPVTAAGLSWLPETGGNAPATPSFAVVKLDVEAQVGLSVRTRWVTDSRHACRETAAAQAEALKRRGTAAVEVKVLPWRSKAHRELVNRCDTQSFFSLTPEMRDSVASRRHRKAPPTR